MVYHSKCRPRRRLTRMSTQRTFAAQGEDLAKKAVVDTAVALSFRLGANYFCSRPNPEYVICNISDDLANKQEGKAGNSLLSFGIWGFVALLAAIIE